MVDSTERKIMASKKEELATLVEQIAEAQGHIEVTKKQMLAGMRRSDQTITAAVSLR